MDAPERIGLIGNGLGQWGLATQDEAMLAVHYVRAAEHDRLMAEKDAELAAARDKALEDAARMLLRKFRSMGLIEDFAAAIRAMKGE